MIRRCVPLLAILAGLAACGSESGSSAVNEANGAAPALPVAPDEAAPAVNEAAPATPESYTARGQEPGWLLTIAGGRIDYEGNYGETKISVPRPEPAPTGTGRRYTTPQIVVDVTNGRCNDAMSGHGYADSVKVTANGQSYDGCGGDRREDWDQ